MVTFCEALHAGPCLHHHARALVTQDRREQALRVFAGEGKRIRVTNTGGFNFDQDFSLPGSIKFNGFNAKGFSGLKGHGSLDVHDCLQNQFRNRDVKLRTYWNKALNRQNSKIDASC